MKVTRDDFDLIVSIVAKGSAEDVMDYAKQAGAEGGTILGGRGTGIHEGVKVFGILFEPEKEVVLILTEQTKTKAVMKSIYYGMKMAEPGNGIIFVIDVAKVAGIVHLPSVDEDEDEA